VESWQPVYECQEHRFKPGEWVHLKEKDGPFDAETLFRFMKYSPVSCYGAIIHVKNINGIEGHILTKNARLATSAEIEDALIKEAKRRMPKIGDKFVGVRDTTNQDLDHLGLTGPLQIHEETMAGSCFGYYSQTDTLFNWGYGLGVLYEKGVWFTIADPVEVITLNCEEGTFEVEVSKKGIFYTPEQCWLNIDDFRTLLSTTRVEIERTNIANIRLEPMFFLYSNVSFGFKSRIPIEDWKKVLEAYDRISK
jgi:hypothetical protein